MTTQQQDREAEQGFDDWFCASSHDSCEKDCLRDAWHAALAYARRQALLDASTEVAGHWNDRNAMCNQYEQAQRSAGILQRMALNMKEKHESGVQARLNDCPICHGTGRKPAKGGAK